MGEKWADGYSHKGQVDYFGTTGGFNQSRTRRYACTENRHPPCRANLDDQLRQFWELESLGITHLCMSSLFSRSHLMERDIKWAYHGGRTLHHCHTTLSCVVDGWTVFSDGRSRTPHFLRSTTLSLEIN